MDCFEEEWWKLGCGALMWRLEIENRICDMNWTFVIFYRTVDEEYDWLFFEKLDRMEWSCHRVERRESGPFLPQKQDQRDRENQFSPLHRIFAMKSSRPDFKPVTIKIAKNPKKCSEFKRLCFFLQISTCSKCSNTHRITPMLAFVFLTKNQNSHVKQIWSYN